MRVLLAAGLAGWLAGAVAAEVTVLRPKSIIADEWTFYVIEGGRAVSDVRNGERATLQLPADSAALVVHCPKMGGGYEERRLDFDFGASAQSFFLLSPSASCVDIRSLDAAAAAPLVRETLPRANRRIDYDPGKVAMAAPAAARPASGDARDEVAAATTAWLEAFNSRDAARIAALYDAEAVLTDTGEPAPRNGAAAIADYYRSAAQRSTQRAALGERSIRVFGDTAIDSGTLTYFEMRGGQATTTPARYSFTYRKRGASWLIVDHHSHLTK